MRPSRSSRTKDSSPSNLQRPRRIGTKLSHDVLNSARVPLLIGEQPNPWDLLQPQDVMSRHRAAKLLRRCGLLGGIDLLSPEYLFTSIERWPFHTEPPDHYDLLFDLLGLSLSQSNTLMLIALVIAMTDRAQGIFALLRTSLGGDRSNQPTHHAVFRKRIAGLG